MNVEEIPVGEGRAYALGDDQVAVFRLRDGTLRALGAVCPHRGGPLADGLIDENVVVCPLHGYTYDLRTGAETSNGGESVRTYIVEIDAEHEIAVREADVCQSARVSGPET